MEIRYIGAATMTGKSYFLSNLDLSIYEPFELDKSVSSKTPSKWNEDKIKAFLIGCKIRKKIPVFAHRFVGKSVRYLKTIGELKCYYIIVPDDQYRENVKKRLTKSGRELTEEYWQKVLKDKQKKDAKFLASYYDQKWDVKFSSISEF